MNELFSGKIACRKFKKKKAHDPVGNIEAFAREGEAYVPWVITTLTKHEL